MTFLRFCTVSLLFLSLFGGFFGAQTNAFENGCRSNVNFEHLIGDLKLSPHNRSEIVEKTSSGGIKELIPAQFQERYEKWKNELLATEIGRYQWQHYSTNNNFTLIVTVSDDKEYGAKTGDYKWNDDGKLIGATITLGKNLDKGYPNAVYYPVMNSLSSHNQSFEISGNILAATKFAHEIGHVNVTAETDGELFQKQNKLMAAYHKIFLKNRYNTNDPRLRELADQLGGMPIQIWADREYRGEANAMRYLAERARKEKFYCTIFNQIKRNISDYAKSYEDRFEKIDVIVSAPICQN